MPQIFLLMHLMHFTRCWQSPHPPHALAKFPKIIQFGKSELTLSEQIDQRGSTGGNNNWPELDCCRFEHWKPSQIDQIDQTGTIIGDKIWLWCFFLHFWILVFLFLFCFVWISTQASHLSSQYLLCLSLQQTMFMIKFFIVADDDGDDEIENHEKCMKD